jgi:pimeloyl-ACP methyl ester carboxylesterase
MTIDTTTPELGAEQRRFLQHQTELLRHYGVVGRDRFVTISDPPLQVHLIEAGEGPPLVLFHGGDGEGANFAALMAELQGRFHCIAVDRPGNGLSQSLDYRHVDLRRHASGFVTSVLDVLGLQQATLVGGSMGGFFALATALDRPERVRDVVLLGMPVGVSRAGPLALRVIGAVPGLARRFMGRVGTIEGQHDQYRKMFHTDPSLLPGAHFETRLASQRLGAAETWATMLPRLVGLRGMRPEVLLVDDLPKISQRVLMVWPEHDMAPVSAGEAACAAIPRGSFVLLPGVGHFPYMEVPERTAELMAGFLT